MNQNIKHNQLKTNTAKLCATRNLKLSAVRAICPSMHCMWTVVAGYSVKGGGAV